MIYSLQIILNVRSHIDAVGSNHQPYDSELLVVKGVK